MYVYYLLLLSIVTAITTTNTLIIIDGSSSTNSSTVRARSSLFESGDALARFLLFLNMLFLHDNNGTYTIKKTCQSLLHKQ